jgi:hypothetical protein
LFLWCIVTLLHRFFERREIYVLQVPFVGFGCMDNGLMILFEHEIEMTIGDKLHAQNLCLDL